MLFPYTSRTVSRTPVRRAWLRTSDFAGSAPGLGIFRGAALPGGVFVAGTAVGHRAEARCHEKFSSSPRTTPQFRRLAIRDELQKFCPVALTAPRPCKATAQQETPIPNRLKL